MHVSAIICTRNRSDLIGTAVASVLANTYPSFDLLVVDQSDDDRTGSVVRNLALSHPNLRYLHTPVPGLSRAYNIGIRETTGEVLAFTDDDCVAPRDWIETIANAFDVDRTADMLYGQVLRPASFANRPDIIPALAIPAPRRFSRRDGFQLYGMGANFAARRRLFSRVGLFDEVLGGGGPLKSSQDFDLQYRAFVAGAVVLLSPEVNVDHYGVRTDEQWGATLRAYGIGDGAFYFKHVRCGDVRALRLMLSRLGRVALSEAFNRLRHRSVDGTYLRSCLEGIRVSRAFAVDRRTRLYHQAA
jgi:glycosyltransferase involved in cell wall biosynthesis